MQHSQPRNRRSKKGSFVSGIDFTNPSVAADVLAQHGPEYLAKLQRGQKQAKGQGDSANKYNRAPPEQRTHEGILFDSKLEMNCHIELKRLGVPFTCQPVFLLQETIKDPDGSTHRCVKYKADMLLGPPRLSEDEPVRGDQLVMDQKGFLTPMFRMKHKMFVARYGVHLYQVKSIKDLHHAVEVWQKQSALWKLQQNKLVV